MAVPLNLSAPVCIRKRMFVLAFVLLWMFAFPQQSDQQIRARLEQQQQQAIELNTLAGQIHSEADARRFVDGVAEVFKKELPPRWVTASIRHRLARAEYAAVSDPARLIPEDRVAGVWNEYVRAIGAPEETLVTGAEIHWLRDAHFAGSQFAWGRQTYHTVWNMPNIYALGADGKVADGCRPLECLRVIRDLDDDFHNVRVARERMAKGILTSDLMKKLSENSDGTYRVTGKRPGTKITARVEISVVDNPVRPAEHRYFQERGLKDYRLLLERLFDELFPE